MKQFNKIGRLEKTEERKSENERLEEFTKTKLKNFDNSSFKRNFNILSVSQITQFIENIYIF